MADQPGFWIPAEPMVLASRSAGRRSLLQAAGIPVDIHPADVDERAIEAAARARGQGPSDIARQLAREKAQAVARALPGRVVLGCDQVLGIEGDPLSKPPDRAAAAAQLRRLSGRSHALHSAACLMQDEGIIAEPFATATLTMRTLSDAFIAHYLDAAGPDVLASVGAYQIEALGAHLFAHVEGDQPTVVGLPLYPLLAALRQARLVRA